MWREWLVTNVRECPYVRVIPLTVRITWLCTQVLQSATERAPINTFSSLLYFTTSPDVEYMFVMSYMSYKTKHGVRSGKSGRRRQLRSRKAWIKNHEREQTTRAVRADEVTSEKPVQRRHGHLRAKLKATSQNHGSPGRQRKRTTLSWIKV